MEVLTRATNVLAASRPPSGTSVLRPPATPRPQPQHPRSIAPRQSQSRTVYNPLVGPLEDDLFAHSSPSQPPLLRCCDDRLNPPSIPEAVVLEPTGPGVLDPPLSPPMTLRYSS